MTYGCIRFINSYRFLSSSLDSLVKTLVGNSHKTLKGFEEETFEKYEILKIVKEIREELLKISKKNILMKLWN